MTRKLLLQRVEGAEDLPLPKRMTKYSAGMDLFANVTGTVTIRKGERALIPTGIRIALPEGYEAQIRARSGIAWKNGVTCLNGPGTVDGDYRGEIHAMLINLGDEDFFIKRGDRIAQMVVARVETIVFVETDSLPESTRGASGFGSTGI